MSVYQIKCGISGAEEEEQGSEEDEEETARLFSFNSFCTLVYNRLQKDGKLLETNLLFSNVLSESELQTVQYFRSICKVS